MASDTVRKHRQQQRAKEEIDNLFLLAEQAQDQKLANRYITLARDIAMRFRLPFTAAQKRRFCKNCGSYLRPGVNARVRVRKGKTTITCLVCKHQRRIPIKHTLNT